MTEEQLSSAQKITEYVAANLFEDTLSLETAARESGYSPFHFHRLFRAWTGETFAQYVRVRRLAGAARELRQRQVNGTQAAFHSGYRSHESFIRSFERMFGASPRRFIGRDCTVKEPKIAYLADRIVAGVACNTNTSQDRNIAKAWKTFGSKWSAITNKLNEHLCYGLEMYEPGASEREGVFAYLACVEVSIAPAESDSGIASFTIPGGRYAVFTHLGSTEILGETFDYIYKEWFPASGEQLRGTPQGGGFDYELYDGRYRDGDPNSELDIYIPLV
ncbi:GyrI-like domain-containing protein [Paenibacillus glycanilyticus]|uniref:AraC family transcriptional regulator n=1 Tax=Paenibacillus glycanilyticus TaxID=126569 RepID=UPI00203DD598|nr:GyrI-like domain-containing protein [Paenibacillus glycanilyticus]MCM3629710.1 GyrI-like domain-containing protein [Paenibacillus glycanilyticus]